MSPGKAGIIHSNIPTDRALEIMASMQTEYDAGYPEPEAVHLWWIGDTYAGNPGTNNERKNGGMTLPNRISKIMVLLVVLGYSVVWGQQLPTTAHPNIGSWQDLFEPDLSNAVISPGGWVMEDGVLSARGHQMIWARETYGDFVVDLEFKVAKGANSGVFLRPGDVGRPVTGIEVQIHETTDGRNYGMAGAIYGARAPSKSMAKPAGQWNRYTIACVDSRIYVVFNGEQVIDIDLDDWTEVHQNPDGTWNKFETALKDYPRVGPVGLQGIHGKGGQLVWFRNLKIRVLD